jgi:hypothetical protein
MSPRRFWTYTIIGLAIATFFMWLGEVLFRNQGWLVKGAGGLLWLFGFLYGGIMGHTALGRLAWRTNAFRFLRSFFPPQ